MVSEPGRDARLSGSGVLPLGVKDPHFQCLLPIQKSGAPPCLLCGECGFSQGSLGVTLFLIPRPGSSLQSVLRSSGASWVLGRQGGSFPGRQMPILVLGKHEGWKGSSEGPVD
jgi:hypothetical protein